MYGNLRHLHILKPNLRIYLKPLLIKIRLLIFENILPKHQTTYNTFHVRFRLTSDVFIYLTSPCINFVQINKKKGVTLYSLFAFQILIAFKNKEFKLF